MNGISRRDFALLSAGTVAASWAVPASGAAEGRIRVGQIGTKHAHAAGQLATLRKFPNVFEIVGVVEPDESHRREVSGHLPYRDLPFLDEEQLLNAPGLQAVAIETEVSHLVPTALRCASANLHLFVDKPAGESLAPYEQLLDEVGRRHLALQMGYMLRYNPAFEFLFQVLDRGWLGEVYAVHAEMSKVIDEPQRRQLRPYRGGAMFELGCHVLDPLVKILGAPDRVATHILRTREDSLADHMVAVLDYPHANAVVRSALCEVGGFSRRQFVVMGSEATIAIRPIESNRLSLELQEAQGDYSRGRHEISFDPRGRYDGLWLSLAEAIRGQRELEWDTQHNRTAHETILRASGLLPAF